MYESPDTLEELCLNSISDNITDYTTQDVQEDPYQASRHFFRDPEIFLFKEISEKLLAKLVEKNILCNDLLTLFDAKHTKLSSVKLRDCHVSEAGLRVLRQHKIVELECIDLKRVDVGEILDCLGEWTGENITSINFSKCRLLDSARHSIILRLVKMKSLRSLSLAHTNLNQTGFNYICEDLKLLEKLDVSDTHVKNLSPLLKLEKTLVSLSISDLSQAKNYVSTLTQLKELRHLDVSVFNEKTDLLSGLECPVVPLLSDPNNFPNLVSLDVSGWKDVIPTETLVNFIETHPDLEFLGIVLNDASFEPVFSLNGDSWSARNLTIAGLGNENQIKVTLRRYSNKPSYLQKALYHLFQLTNIQSEARPDMFNLVLPVMASHSKKFGVQMAATACLYNLTRGELSKKIHPQALSRGVNLTLQAMEAYPEEFQLQKNSLLTLCSDTILQEINFNRFRCARLVLEALCNFDDVNMNRMAVAICSILAAKVSTSETSQLGSNSRYMKKLLKMVQNRVDSIVSDITLKFTLSALWNLTDESAATCRVFLELDGAELFLNVLQAFKDDSAIETKVLGLLNNIAEVIDLRSHLMMDNLINELALLLQSENIDVSYFAAGIVAHLASDGPGKWTVTSHTRNGMLGELESAVSQWKVPDSEMVAYRSFRPFFPLLKPDMDYQVQLWAVWAIHHVCTKNPKRYCVMLKDECGFSYIQSLYISPVTQPGIKLITSQILETVTGHV